MKTTRTARAYKTKTPRERGCRSTRRNSRGNQTGFVESHTVCTLNTRARGEIKIHDSQIHAMSFSLGFRTYTHTHTHTRIRARTHSGTHHSPTFSPSFFLFLISNKVYCEVRRPAATTLPSRASPPTRRHACNDRLSHTHRNCCCP